MLFNSYLFIFLFLPVTFGVYFLLNQRRLTLTAKTWLALCSLVFYGYWNIAYVPLILGSIAVNYCFGKALRRAQWKMAGARKSALAAGIVLNLALLGYFKYTDFLIANFNAVTGGDFPLLHLVLPLGISFFTFTQIAYLVDSYKNVTKEESWLSYLLFVVYFPHLIAGPIVHHKDLMPQFDHLRNKVLRYDNIARGLFIFALGLFKKTIVADSLAMWANQGYGATAGLDFSQAWITSLSYTFQLYFDFSAYIDMAVGASLLFNITLPQNFNSPYKARDIQDFWRRWHMTLSRFLRDYVYIPLGGNRGGEWAVCRNILLTFVLGGLWHGASWTFVFWGFLHGAAMIIHRIWVKLGARLSLLTAWFITFNFVNISWVFFRAKNWSDACNVLKAMAGFSGGAPLDELDFIKRMALLALALFVAVFLRNSDQLTARMKPTARYAFAAVALAFISLLGMTRVTEFLYFNF